jgi:hypothetical protein
MMEVLIKAELCELLADVIDSFGKDIETAAGQPLRREEKRRQSDLKQAAKTLRIRAQALTNPHPDHIDQFCDNAEFLETVILTAIRKAGGSAEKRNELINKLK